MDIDGVKVAAANWEAKFKASEKEWQKKLDVMAYAAAAKDAVSDIKFSSNYAKKGISFASTQKFSETIRRN